jgi:oxygen-independent coproporphyrinogen-3 oxidase
VSTPVKQTLAPPQVPWLHPRAAYLHVPFCAQRCGYCDFATVAGQDALADRYLDALEMEIATVGTPQEVETIFIGGGTPTHLNHRQLERLMRMVREWIRLSRNHEWTVEANPGTLDAAKVDILAEHGVNRVSLGAQSFHRPLLRVLERNHDPADVPRAVELVRRCIDNVSLDLIFGVPGQTLKQWQDDLTAALALSPSHLSTYGLTYEKGTPLWKQRERGEVKPADEELERAMYAEAMDRLAAAGFEQYEISNYALPGQRCRHNLVYWANHAYFGFGLGAARYVLGCRAVNTRDLLGYIDKISRGQPAIQQSETLEPEERVRETAVVQIRRMDGIERQSFLEQTGCDLDDLVGEAVQRHVAGGLLADDGARVRLTREGKFLADTVAAAFL